MLTATFFILGSIFGSFINVLIYRWYKEEDWISGRSYCPKCKKTIRWYDNIPLVSFIILGGRCRDCGKKISWQYPIVEFSSGIILAFLFAQFYNPLDYFSWIIFIYLGVLGLLLLVILVYDFLYMEIPALALWSGIIWVISFSIFFAWFRDVSSNLFYNPGLVSGFLAAFGSFIIFYITVLISHEKWMGMGDAYLMILLGFILGWPRLLMALFLAFSLGAVYGILLIAIKNKTLKTQIPFAPFLIIGTLIAFSLFEIIWKWYKNLIFLL